MKVLYIHQHFTTYAEGGSSRSYYLAKALVEKGIGVELITCHNHVQYETSTVDGIKVHYLPIYYDNAQGFLGRGKSFLNFVIQATKLALTLPNLTICYAVSTPLTTGIIALYLKYKRQIPYYFEVGDLWPLAPIQMGAISNPLLKKSLFALERKIYQQAEKIIALSPSIREAILQVVPKHQVYLVPNMSDCDFFTNTLKQPIVEQQFSVENKFVVTYFGTVGKANHLQYLLDIAEFCQSKTDQVAFFIVGKGAELSKLKSIAQKRRLTNVQFIDHMAKAELRDFLTVTDAVYISFAKKPVLETGSPNKFFDALAAGKLCIVNMGGWISQLISQEKCGFYADPDSPTSFYEQLSPFLQNRALLTIYQRNARHMAETQFSRSLITQKFTQLFM